MRYCPHTLRNGFIQLGAERVPATIEIQVERNMRDVTVFGSNNPTRIPDRTETEIRARVSASDGMRMQGLFDGMLAISVNGEMLVGAARLVQVSINDSYGDLSFQCGEMSVPDLRQRTRLFREANL